MYKGDYQKKLTTAARAVEHIAPGSTLVHGMGTGEPPALLGALADRVRAGDLVGLKVFSLLPMEHIRQTLLAPELSDRLRPIPGLSPRWTGTWCSGANTISCPTNSTRFPG
jgi:itaconate CoA-transferase